jgi:hypothetical protein
MAAPGSSAGGFLRGWCGCTNFQFCSVVFTGAFQVIWCDCTRTGSSRPARPAVAGEPAALSPAPGNAHQRAAPAAALTISVAVSGGDHEERTRTADHLKTDKRTIFLEMGLGGKFQATSS